MYNFLGQAAKKYPNIFTNCIQKDNLLFILFIAKNHNFLCKCCLFFSLKYLSSEFDQVHENSVCLIHFN